MFWDVMIAMLGAAAQFITAYVGWKATDPPIRPDEERRRSRYRLVFVAAGVFGVCMITAATIRSGIGLEAIRHGEEIIGVNIGALRANLSYTKDDPIRLKLISADAGQPLLVEVSKHNIGSEEAIHLKNYSVAAAYDRSSEFRQFCEDIEQKLHDLATSGTETPETTVAPGGLLKFNAVGPQLSQDLANKIKDGTVGVYVAGLYSYSDKNHKDSFYYNWRYRITATRGFANCRGDTWILDWK